MPFDLMAHAEGHSSDSLRSSSRRSSGAGLADNPFVRSDSLTGAERRPSLSTGNSGVQRYTGVPSANAVKVMAVPSPTPSAGPTPITSSNPSPASEEAPTAAHSWLAGALQAKAELPSPPRAPPAIAYPPVAAPTLAQKTVSAPAVAVTAVAVTPVSVTPPASPPKAPPPALELPPPLFLPPEPPTKADDDYWGHFLDLDPAEEQDSYWFSHTRAPVLSGQ